MKGDQVERDKISSKKKESCKGITKIQQKTKKRERRRRNLRKEEGDKKRLLTRVIAYKVR